MAIPEWRLERWVKVQIEETKSGRETLHVTGMDKTGGPFDLFKGIKIDGVLSAHRSLSE